MCVTLCSVSSAPMGPSGKDTRFVKSVYDKPLTQFLVPSTGVCNYTSCAKRRFAVITRFMRLLTLWQPLHRIEFSDGRLPLLRTTTMALVKLTNFLQVQHRLTSLSYLE